MKIFHIISKVLSANDALSSKDKPLLETQSDISCFSHLRIYRRIQIFDKKGMLNGRK